ncbi:lipoprotein [Bordetella ansorpii]|uniref:Lipoprotein n=1 Tax=Bordetella ansorpii TaxID=288768 RepID=A0A157RP53_9BORD|nr:lipoprotein [Bordetella ansorpii]
MKWTTALAGVALGMTLSAGARAETSWPKEKPITIVVPFPAGGSTDTIARMMSKTMQNNLGQSIVIDNKPGATGIIGMSQAKRAAPDGYTLVFASLGPFVIVPHLNKATPYDARKDFDYITIPVQAPNVLVTRTSHAVKSVAEAIAELKAKPGTVTFANSGFGASDHLSAELFFQQTKTAGLHVPYKGGAPAINDLIGGQVEYSFQNVNAVLPYIQAGQMRALAVTGTHRSPVLPDVPTLAESGVTGAEVYSWQGLAAPAGLPADVKDKLAQAAVKAIKDPAVASQLEKQGLEIVANDPATFAAYQAKEWDRWGRLISTRGIKME